MVVGASDGTGDGTAVVGAGLGGDVGEDVGATVGTRLGAGLGGNVGTDVGAVVGTRLGAGLGGNVGTDVGAAVGTRLGAGLGDGVGTDVGAAVIVGAAVGAQSIVRVRSSAPVPPAPHRKLQTFAPQGKSALSARASYGILHDGTELRSQSGYVSSQSQPETSCHLSPCHAVLKKARSSPQKHVPSDPSQFVHESASPVCQYHSRSYASRPSQQFRMPPAMHAL